MKLLAISEHYFPRVGGTVNYVHETLTALTQLGVEIELLVPGPISEGWLPESMSTPSYQVRWVDAGYPARGDPTRDQRYDFCRKVNTLAFEAAQSPNRADLLHVMFGMFVMETLDTGRLWVAGLPCVATVHNVPPMECRLVPDTAPLASRLRETLRLMGVALKNKSRLKRHAYDLYVVPSEQVRALLEPLVSAPVTVIGHGRTSDLAALMRPPASRHPDGGPVRLLTVGGYAPHKRQHLIPEVATRLCAAGLAFEWNIVGPTGRLTGYYDHVVKEVERAGLAAVVRAHGAVPFAALASLYDGAHLYVQPSIEEGFCITALDAAAAGLPVIASPAGALPQIVKASGGRLVRSDANEIAQAIAGFVAEDAWQLDCALTASRVQTRFSWTAAAVALCTAYNKVIATKVA